VVRVAGQPIAGGGRIEHLLRLHVDAGAVGEEQVEAGAGGGRRLDAADRLNDGAELKRVDAPCCRATPGEGGSRRPCSCPPRDATEREAVERRCVVAAAPHSVDAASLDEASSPPSEARRLLDRECDNDDSCAPLLILET
jgi:hypothetical protein